MGYIAENIQKVRASVQAGVQLVCVSKFHPAPLLMQAYEAGERDFGESRVQELKEKYDTLPKDVRWHFIGHLQTNKVKQLLPMVYMIHGVDSLHLLEVISDEAVKQGRVVKVLLEVHVAQEESKTGFALEDMETVQSIVDLNRAPAFLREYPGVEICGLMGMASHTEDEAQIRSEFETLHTLFVNIFPHGGVLSMGMSEDYVLAQEEGSNMVRIGSAIFGERV